MLLLLLACFDGKVIIEDTQDTGTEAVDQDGDGFDASQDCDDDNDQIHPDAEEICDGLDNDCSGEADDDAVDAVAYWGDSDQDGFGAGEQLWACTPPTETADNGSDCDDTRSEVNPDAQEVCDGASVDEDCDGLVNDDDDSVDPATYQSFYPDVDGDGYGDQSMRPALACEAGEGQVDNNQDCDDSDASTWECPEVSWDGHYSGDITITVSVPDFGVSDDCVGTGSVDISEADSPQIYGEVTCTLGGTLGGLIGTELSATIDGEILPGDLTEGELDLSGYFQALWTGNISETDGLEGSLSGSAVYSGYPIDYSGTFQFRQGGS